jgi:hypothetical protein
MNEFNQNLWGWASGVFIFITDHWSGIAAFVLFALQAIYQVYRIRHARKECQEPSTNNKEA